MKGFTVLVADDHPILRLGISQLLSGHDRFSVTGQAQNGTEAIELIKAQSPDIALIDMMMPETDGLAVIRFAANQQLTTKMVLMTAFLDDEVFAEVMSLGIAGVLLKTNALGEVLDCLNKVATGLQYVSPGYKAQFGAQQRPTVGNSLELQALSTTERQVLAMIANNLSSQQIAQQLGRSPETIKKHRNHICKKLDLTGKNALLTFALRNRHLLINSE